MRGASQFSVPSERTWAWLRVMLGVLGLALIGLLVWQERDARHHRTAEETARLDQARLSLERVAEDAQRALDDLATTFSGSYAASDSTGVGLAARQGQWRATSPRPGLLERVCVQAPRSRQIRCLDAAGVLRPATAAERARLRPDAANAAPPMLLIRLVESPPRLSRSDSVTWGSNRFATAMSLRFLNALKRSRTDKEDMRVVLQRLEAEGLQQVRLFGTDGWILLVLNERVVNALPELLWPRYLSLMQRAEVDLSMRRWRPGASGVSYVLRNAFGQGEAFRSAYVTTAGSVSGQPGRQRVDQNRPWTERAFTSVPVWTLDVATAPVFARQQARAARAASLLRLAAGLLALGVLGLVYVAARRAQRLADDRMAFAAAVSHELRTPVAAMLTAAENLRDGVVTEPARVANYGALLAEEAARLRRTVEQTLALARPDTLSERTDVDLVALARAVVARVEAQRPAQPLHVGAVAPVHVWGDAAALDGALANLVENAVKYGQGQPVRVVVRGTPTGAEVQVEDHGIGLAAGEAARVFEPFYRSARAQAVASGVGLGLTLVRRVAEAHGGAVTAEARAGGGAVFTLTIPAGKS